VLLLTLGGAACGVDAGSDSGTASTPELAPGYMRAPYLQSLGSDSVLVAWIASAAGDPAVDFGTTLEYGNTTKARSDGARRVATLRGLEPATTYFYRVRAGERVLAEGRRYTFRTDAGGANRHYSFFVTGDIGYRKGKQALTEASILRADPRPELGILCGDIVYKKGRSRDYDRKFMRPWKDLLCTIPVWPALGNHDWGSSPKRNWEREWYLPHNEHYYSFDYGNAHFIALDTRDGSIWDLRNQVAWLQQDLDKHRDSEWLFVYFHHPGITCTYKENNEAVIEHFMPLFDRYGVDVVFAGHAHTYERLFPIYDSKPVNREQDPHYTDPKATLYIVSGAGARVKKDKPTSSCGPTAFFRDETILWTHVLVDGPRCTIRSYASADDALVDEVSITKTRLAREAGSTR
jgi:hypothetical protein